MVLYRPVHRICIRRVLFYSCAHVRAKILGWHTPFCSTTPTKQYWKALQLSYSWMWHNLKLVVGKSDYSRITKLETVLCQWLTSVASLVRPIVGHTRRQFIAWLIQHRCGFSQTSMRCLYLPMWGARPRSAKRRTAQTATELGYRVQRKRSKIVTLWSASTAHF